MAATAAPGIQFKVGQSLSELSALGRELGVIRKQLQGIRQDAQQAASGINQINGGLVNRHGQPLRPPEPPAAPTPHGARPPKAPAANADRNLFAGMMGSTGMSDAEWKELGKKQAKRREEALKAGMELNPTERKEYSRTRAVNAAMRARTGEDVQGLLGRAVNAAGWSPFMPQSVYLAQMALGEMGLGLSLPFVAGGMGALAVGAAGLGLNAFATNEARSGAQLVSAAGTNGPFAANAYVTTSDEARLLQQREGQLHLSDAQATQAVSALAGGGVGASDAFGLALQQTAALVNGFGMSVQDAAGMVATWRTDMRLSDDQVTQALASLAKTADATGQPLSALGQIVSQTPNMLADLAGDPSQYGPAAAMLRALGGSTQNAMALGNIAYASGSQALSLAAQMGISDQQFNALQNGGAGGQQKIDDFILGVIRQSMTQSGGAVDQAMLMANGRLGANLDKATFLRLANLPANATASAYQQALGQPNGTTAPGAADALIKALETGNVSGASTTANPWNVKDMAVNAAQVFLTGASGQAATAAQIVAHGGAFSDAQLRQVAANGGIDAALANAQLLRRGNMSAAGSLARQLASGVLSAASIAAKPEDATVAAMLQRAAQSVAGPPPSAPGNGGGGQVITINLQTDGRQVASLPVKIGPNQQFDQYVPRWHAPGRGPQ